MIRLEEIDRSQRGPEDKEAGQRSRVEIIYCLEGSDKIEAIVRRSCAGNEKESVDEEELDGEMVMVDTVGLEDMFGSFSEVGLQAEIEPGEFSPLTIVAHF